MAIRPSIVIGAKAKLLSWQNAWSLILAALASICLVGNERPCIKNVRATRALVVTSVFKIPPSAPGSGSRMAKTTAPIRASVNP